MFHLQYKELPGVPKLSEENMQDDSDSDQEVSME